MDRAIVYPGSIPMDTDLLRSERYGKQALGRFSEMVFGAGVSSACGLVCTPSSSALSLKIGAGSIVAPGVVDAVAYGGVGGGLGADQTPIACQYVNTVVQTVVLPSSGATYTIFAVCSEQDVDASVLPFFNAGNPGQTQAGPGNSGGDLPTRRTGTMQFVAATTAPVPPAGGSLVALYTVTVPSGATTLAGVVPAAGQVFWPTIPELATLALVQAACAPMGLVGANCALAVPAWASRVEVRVIGGGGGGATSSATSASDGSYCGAGGGAGGEAWGIYAVSPIVAGGLSISIGAGGAEESSGGTTLVSYDGTTLLQAQGGAGGSFYAPQGSAGGGGGMASGGTIWNLTGTFGGDGQCGTATFSGYGGDGPWGGGGRSGNTGGKSATKYGAGGGGAYSASSAGVVSPGGSGFQGCVLYRFLP